MISHVKNKKIVLEKTCCSDTKEIAGIEKFLNKIKNQLKLDDGTMYRILIACTEAVNNAILHGNKLDPTKKIIIKFIMNNRWLTIKVKDEGDGFNPKILEDPRKKKNLLKENGRGVFLMQNLMDTIKMKKLKSGLLVEMKLKIP